MLLNEIHLRDPFVLPDGGRYWLYGTRCAPAPGVRAPLGFDVYSSADLEHWEAPAACFAPPAGFWSDRDYFAPEVWRRQGEYCMFASFKSGSRHRGTQILRAAGPAGPFVPDAAPLTPPEWESIDGTLYVDGHDAPWMVFCREWVQVGNGEIWALPLSADLRRAAGEPQLLFRAQDAAWTHPISDGRGWTGTVTDGPFLYRLPGGALALLWSSFGADGRYAEAEAVSDGGLSGPWRHPDAPLYAADGGHGMVFSAFDGRLFLVLHTPNRRPDERPRLLPVRAGRAGLELI